MTELLLPSPTPTPPPLRYPPTTTLRLCVRAAGAAGAPSGGGALHRLPQLAQALPPQEDAEDHGQGGWGHGDD